MFSIWGKRIDMSPTLFYCTKNNKIYVRHKKYVTFGMIGGWGYKKVSDTMIEIGKL
jgi:hypothetical protein